MGHIPEMKININSEEHFPAYQPDLDMTPPNADWKWDKESIESSPGPSSLSSQGNGLSFAKVICNITRMYFVCVTIWDY